MKQRKRERKEKQTFVEHVGVRTRHMFPQPQFALKAVRRGDAVVNLALRSAAVHAVIHALVREERVLGRVKGPAILVFATMLASMPVVMIHVSRG